MSETQTSIIDDYLQLIEIFEEYGYYIVDNDLEIKFSIDIIMNFKRMVLIYPLFHDTFYCYSLYFRKYFNFDINQLDKDALIAIFKHDDEIANIITTNVNLFKGYLNKVTLTTPCNICYEDKTEAYQCGQCHGELCIDCYNSIKNNYSSKCIYCNYSLFDHVSKQAKVDI